MTSLLVILSLQCGVQSLTFTCKFDVQTIDNVDYISCDDNIESYDGEGFRMVSSNQSALDAYGSSRNDDRRSPLFRSVGTKPLNEITEVVKFTAHKCSRLPKSIGSSFGAVKSFTFSGGGLWRLTKNDLREFPDEIYFDYSNNRLQYLETDLFMYNPMLKGVDMKGNEIMQISPKLGLDKLSDLMTFELTENLCTSTTYFCSVGSTGKEKCSEEMKNFIAALSEECPEKETELIAEIHRQITKIGETFENFDSKLAAVGNDIANIHSVMLRIGKIIEMALDDNK